MQVKVKSKDELIKYFDENNYTSCYETYRYGDITFPVGMFDYCDKEIEVRESLLEEYDYVYYGKNECEWHFLKEWVEELAEKEYKPYLGETFCAGPSDDFDTVFGPKSSIDDLGIKTDNVNHPEHYLKFGVEVKDIIEFIVNHENNKHLTKYQAYCMGNDIKYRLRCGFKGEEDKIVEDIKKAMFYYKERN